MTFHHNTFLTCSLSCIVAANGRPSETLAIIVNKTIVSEFYCRFSVTTRKIVLQEILRAAPQHPPFIYAKLIATDVDVAAGVAACPFSTLMNIMTSS